MFLLPTVLKFINLKCKKCTVRSENKNMTVTTKTFGCLTLFFMVIIFIFSSQTADSSEDLSDMVGRIILNIIEPGVHTSSINLQNDVASGTDRLQDDDTTLIPVPKKEWFGIKPVEFRNFIRKAAHFTLFMFLGFFSCCTMYSHLGKLTFRVVVICLVGCLAYAVTDEVHQFFIDGRAAQLSDVRLDFIGSILGVALSAGGIFLINRIKKRRIS